MNEILRNNLFIREWVNGGLIPLNLSLVLVIGLFLWDAWTEVVRPHHHFYPSAPWPFDRYRRFLQFDGVPIACVLFWIFLADAIRAAAAFAVLWRANNAFPAAKPIIESGWISAGFLFAGIVGLVASVRCIYLFTPTWFWPSWMPPKLRLHWYWMTSAIVTTLFVVSV